MTDSTIEVTVLIQRANSGDASAASRLFKVVRDHLHCIAERQLADESAGTSLQATMLVDDAFMQLTHNGRNVDLKDRYHFYVLAARAMRRILVDRARHRKALKRGGPHWKKSLLQPEYVAVRAEEAKLLDLHEALKELAEIEPRQAQVIELRHFGGYSVEDTAKYLNVSASTVKQDFAAAKEWLFHKLS